MLWQMELWPTGGQQTHCCLNIFINHDHTFIYVTLISTLMAIQWSLVTFMTIWAKIVGFSTKKPKIKIHSPIPLCHECHKLCSKFRKRIKLLMTKIMIFHVVGFVGNKDKDQIVKNINWWTLKTKIQSPYSLTLIMSHHPFHQKKWYKQGVTFFIMSHFEDLCIMWYYQKKG